MINKTLVSPGFDGRFYWFNGVVESTNDPRKMGRLRVRIIGKDTENLGLIPTDSLIWAMPLHPSTGTHFSIDIKPGDWVFGFFLDGQCGLQPAILGTWPGVKYSEPDTSMGYSKQLTEEEKKEEPVSPADIVTAGNKIDSITGAPQLSRGIIEGTQVKKTNQQLAHVCDFSLDVKKSAFYQRFKRSEFMQAVRSLLMRLSQIFGITPDEYTSKLIADLKRFAAWLKEIQKNIKIIQDFITFVVDFANFMGSIIKWILSLPEKFLNFLGECLKSFASATANILKDLLTVPGVTGSNDINQLLDTVKETTEQLGKTVNSSVELATAAINLPTAVGSALVNPTTSDISIANTLITQADNFTTTLTEQYNSSYSNTATNITESINDKSYTPA